MMDHVLTYGDIARLLKMHTKTVIRARHTLGLEEAEIRTSKRGVRFSVAVLRARQPWFKKLAG